jgi:hypothetical protein
MGDSDVACFSHSLKLTHLYLQCPSADNEVNDGLCGDNEVSDGLCGDPDCGEGE